MTLVANCKQHDLCCMPEQEDASSFIQSWKTTDSLLSHDRVGGNCCRYSFKTVKFIIHEKSCLLAFIFISVALAWWERNYG